MKNYIMFYSGNWNDEIDVDGFVVVNKTEMCYINNFLKRFKDPISISLGFGDDVEYDNGRDLLEEISFQEISPQENETIKKFFGSSNDFGDNLIVSIRETSLKYGIEFKM